MPAARGGGSVEVAPQSLGQRRQGAVMRMLNPARAIWRYMRGDDIREANARAIAAHAAEEAAAGTTGTVPAPRDPVERPVSK